MATKYEDIIQLRGGKAAYNIAEEKAGEWTSFIPNDQFNEILRQVLKSVRGNDIDNHKSFWINGTYGTGKSHAVAVISHLLGDEIDDIKDWVNYEYGSEKFATIRTSIMSLREKKRLVTVKVYGMNAMTHASDLALVLQKSVKDALAKENIEICVPTDFETYINQINRNPEIWDHLIENNTSLSSIVGNRDQLISNLKDNDLSTFHRVTDTLRDSQLDIRMENNSIKDWLIEIQNKLADLGKYNGLLIVWDEFTDVMTDAIGLQVLKELQEIAEKFANEENNSYMFLISHPSAFDKVGSELLKQTDGRYHRMKYNMEPVSAFKIMSRKFEITDKEKHEQLCKQFYDLNPDLLRIFTQTSNDQKSTTEDLFNLFPLHPGTANLATHYATVIGSSSRSVFEFLGQNDAIRSFLTDENHFLNRDTITPDYLWDYVLKVFQDDVTNYGAVTERFNSYIQQVSNQGDAYFAIFKGILLLNAFNNVSGENNNGLVTPSEENVHSIFAGTKYEDEITTVLNWFNEQGIIQRAPGGLFSVQFSALPSKEIEDAKIQMKEVQFKQTSQILEFCDFTETIITKRMMQTVVRPYKFKFYSDVENESSLRSKIKNGRKDCRNCEFFFAMFLGRNNEELAKLRTFAEKCATDEADKDLKNIVFIVFDEVFGDSKYEQFIEYQANYYCASSHGFLDQQRVHRDHANAMVKEWLDSVLRNNATIYINGFDKLPLSVKHLSSVIKKDITRIIFPFAPDANELLLQKAPSTFWKPQNSKEIVRTFLFATSKEEFNSISAQMRPIQYLIQDCLDENLNWKADIPEGDPFKAVYDKVNSIIKHADKSSQFNFDEKFSLLTKPPYGYYGNYATMGAFAFALKPWINKIFDPQGKPRDANALIDDIVMLFKVWDDKKSNSKLNFKFQTPEEGKLCKELISLFNLNSKDSAYTDVTSLKDARFAITGDFLEKMQTPLWVIKYAPESIFPIKIKITDEIKRLTDNIVTICSEKDLRNPALISETLNLIDSQRFEMKNLINTPAAFSEGFNTYLKTIQYVNVTTEELDDVKSYVHQHLESTVGYWSEEEVEKKVLQWKASQMPHPEDSQNQPHTPDTYDGGEDIPTSEFEPNTEVLKSKRKQAKEKINMITNLEDAKQILNIICEKGNEWVIDLINE